MKAVLAAALCCAAVCAQPPSQREQLLERMKQQPDAPWPPMRGHVILAAPGTRMEQKGYHEPGAWFSPAPGTFGITIVPKMASKQRFDGLFGIETSTSAWKTRWSVSKPCQFELEITPLQPGVEILVQSAGPAGGPLSAVEHRGMTLILNDRWSLAPIMSAKLGGEGGWRTARVPVKTQTRLLLTTRTPCGAAGVTPQAGGPSFQLPDPRFVDSIQAQISQLLMGITGEETRPGETLNYPLAWLRDGAYSLAALARAGQVNAARVLARKFAEEDFFGGFGAEADGPGLAIWALNETSTRVRDSDFDHWLWPHVWRKAEYIVRMRHAVAPIREIVRGPIVPRHQQDPNLGLVCEAARDGLIVGRMDHHRPLLYVNGMSYAGLMNAAAFARRMYALEDAERWTKEAAELRLAWWRAFDTKERDNERTAIVGLWPSAVAADQPARYRAALEKGWDAGFAKTPLWTYFDLARAHNWLLAGEPEKAWQTLEYFWKNQASPGLYTMWEGSGEENSFGLWQDVRGWATPPHVTPHYWAASEMLHLQLDMLVHEDAHGLVIGAGVPAEWLKQELSVTNLASRSGMVSWQWSQGKLTVTLDGRPVAFRAGPAFPKTGRRE
jgi:hypothetical protein